MICLDFSEDSKKAFHTALKMINSETDEVILVSIVEIYKADLINTIKAGCDMQILDEANDQMIKETNDLLQSYWDVLNSKQIKSEIIAKVGTPRDMICNLAEKYQVDTLVLGSRGLSPIKRMVIGSVSDYCLHNAKVTTLLVVH